MMCVFYRKLKQKPPADFVSGDTSSLLTPPGFFSWQPNVTDPAARAPPPTHPQPPPPTSTHRPQPLNNNQYVQSRQTVDQTSLFSEHIIASALWERLAANCLMSATETADPTGSRVVWFKKLQIHK